MSERSGARIEQGSSLLLEHIVQHVGGVHLARTLVPHDYTSFGLPALVEPVTSLEEPYVRPEHVERDTLLGGVHQTSTNSQSAKRSDIPTLPALRLNDEHPIPTRARALLDRIARIDQRVERGIATKRELGHRDVVADRCGEMDERDAECRVVFARLEQDAQGGEGFEAADHEERVELVFLELGGYGPEVDVLAWKLAVRAEFRTAADGPAGKMSIGVMRKGRWDAYQLSTPSHESSCSESSIRPLKPLWTAMAVCPRWKQYRAAARVAAFIPPAGAPMLDRS